MEFRGFKKRAVDYLERQRFSWGWGIPGDVLNPVSAADHFGENRTTWNLGYKAAIRGLKLMKANVKEFTEKADDSGRSAFGVVPIRHKSHRHRRLG